MQPQFFKDKNELRKWFKKNHKMATELLLGYYRVNSGKPSVNWPDSVDEAICVGWIDGVRRTIDETSYTIRFTPRRPDSIWSAVNIAKVERLTKEGLMYPEGLAAFEKRQEHKSRIYSFEKEAIELAPVYETQFKMNKKAWEFFSNAAPSYRKRFTHRVMGAKQEKTRISRLEKLIADCEAGKKFWLEG
jgi:uncharacterized protein YdeI (YjbR/CyaY-like superfamily)